MREVVMIIGERPRKLLEAVVNKRIPVVMSYQGLAGWQWSRVIVTGAGEDGLDVRVTPQRRNNRAKLEEGQNVGISFKYGYGGGYDKFIFNTEVMSIDAGSGEISLKLPEDIEVVPRRSYYRVRVPKQLEIKVKFWHRYCTSDGGKLSAAVGPQWEGKLIDLSASGLQVAFEKSHHDFEDGQFIGLNFTPMQHETPLAFNAQVRHIYPTADGGNICFGLKMIGLEASPEGRMILARIVSVVEEYHEINKKEKKDS